MDSFKYSSPYLQNILIYRSNKSQLIKEKNMTYSNVNVTNVNTLPVNGTLILNDSGLYNQSQMNKSHVSYWK